MNGNLDWRALVLMVMVAAGSFVALAKLAGDDRRDRTHRSQSVAKLARDADCRLVEIDEDRALAQFRRTRRYPVSNPRVVGRLDEGQFIPRGVFLGRYTPPAAALLHAQSHGSTVFLARSAPAGGELATLNSLARTRKQTIVARDRRIPSRFAAAGWLASLSCPSLGPRQVRALKAFARQRRRL